MGGHRDQPGSEYHLEFVTRASTSTFSVKVDAMLDDIYEGECPLSFSSCRAAQNDGRRVIQVRFCLRNRSRSHTLETAGQDLCKRLFKSENRYAIRILTRESILGVSASCKEWRRWFRTALFSSSLVEGSEFLKGLNEEASKSNYFQDWLLVLAYAVFAGLNLSLFSTGVLVASEAAAGMLLAPDSAELLELYTAKKKDERATTLSKWESSTNAFNKSCDETIRAIKKYSRRSISGGALRDELFNLAHHCGELVTSNEAVLKVMKDARAATMRKLITRAGGAAGAAAIVSSTITASTVVTSVGVAPLSAWLTSGPLLVETATVLGCAAPPLAITCAAFGFWHLIQAAKERKKHRMWEKEIVHCETLKSLTIAVWNLAAETDAFLVWARCAHMKKPHRRHATRIDAGASIDNMAWQRITQFIRNHQEQEAEIPRNATARRALVRHYVAERRRELKKARRNLTTSEDAVRRRLDSWSSDDSD